MQIKFCSIKKFKCAIGLTLIALISVGCGKAKVTVYHDAEVNWDYPKTVAVLPFSYDAVIEENKRPHKILREVFFNYFSYMGFTDIPLNTVDFKIAPVIKSGVTVDSMSNSQLIKALGTDAVVRGHVVNATNITAGIYSETSIEAKLEMIDLRTDELLWETEHMELDSSGIGTLSLVDMIEDQAANSAVGEAYHKVAESFILKVLAKIPDPANLRHEEVQLPHIASIETNIKGNGKLHTNDLIYVSMKGESKLAAHFDIGSFQTRIPMKEVTPGLYTGSYRVKEGDQSENALIIGSLTNKRGLTAKKFYKRALAVIE